ncbi:hypothetical protein PsYK624_116970 [Phanerochaete sordida]|uniref:Mediator of RNA polymerase II transcription subunit 1 n=1 Tax=Phanerochaete sordida TaxID=48140 RepID=A0A9P3GH44_9APHY|nr:hypothetical protein PsYK624_116970 [Phanerochaete sordida]
MDLSSSQPGPSSANARTILSLVQDFSAHEAFPSQSTHPFSRDSESAAKMLRELADATMQVSASLNAHVTLPMNNPKLFSLFKQQTNIAQTVHNAEQTIRKTTDILRRRAGILYGEDVPLDRAARAGWCLDRLAAWATAAGMQAFREEHAGHVTLTLAGRVVVVDTTLALDAAARMRVTGVKTSYAVRGGADGATTAGSASLDGFLAQTLRGLLAEVQRTDEQLEPEEVHRVGTRIADSLKYLMMLDKLAEDEGDPGLRWFNNVDALASEVERFASEEAAAITRELSSEPCPLDIFLTRAHGLPLPYLSVPSLSFLIHISPRAYLTMLRSSSSSPATPSSPSLPALDIPFAQIRAYAGRHPRPAGLTTVHLVLTPSGDAALGGGESPVGMEALAVRPTFALAPWDEQKDVYFPARAGAGAHAGAHGYVLDFTDGGAAPGVVMSQSRMKEIEMVLNPFGGMESQVPIMGAAAAPSWVDMLLSPHSHLSPEYYTTVYTSPTSAHPPLQLRLEVPVEPGFRLEKIHVHHIKTVWGVLEIVKEQCWLNEILLGAQWVPEGINPEPSASSEADKAEATEDELQAVLGGSITPSRIPVNVYLHNGVPVPMTDPFDPSEIAAMSVPQRVTKVVMTAPERPPISGLVGITVAYDNTRARGVAVAVNGAMGADLRLDALEEVCRRGGMLGLPGRVWARSQGLP